jgi:hypothetical protein
MHRSFDCALAYARALLRMTREGWRRIKKIQLIVSVNPTWKDLAEDWFPLSRTPITRPTAHPGQGNVTAPITKPMEKRLMNAPSNAARLSGN